MRKLRPFIYLAIIVTQFTVGCQKDAPLSTTPLQPPVIPVPPPVTSTPPPVVYAGPDIKIEIPRTDVKLACSVNLTATNIKSYHWEKISGPECYFLEWHNQPSARVFWMEEGEYEFEVTVTDNQLRVHSDKIKVGVFSNLKKHVINDLTRDVSGFSTAQIPVEVANNIKWVFGKNAGRQEHADAGPYPGIDYSWGGYYYNLLSGNQISVYGGYSNDPTIDVTIYY